MSKHQVSFIFYLIVILLGATLGFLCREQNNNDSFIETLDCSAHIVFYGEGDKDNFYYTGKSGIKFNKDYEGVIHLVGQMRINNENYSVFKKVEVFYELIDKNDVMLKTKKLIRFPRLDTLPPEIEKKLFFKIYYLDNEEMNYEFSRINDKYVLVSVSLIPRFICVINQ
jgi:hypothetical protein